MKMLDQGQASVDPDDRLDGGRAGGRQPDLLSARLLRRAGTIDRARRARLTQWVLKVAWEALLTPVTYAVVGWLKRREGVDVYDEGTDFTPFRAKV